MAKDMKIEEQRLFGMIDSMNFSDAELALGVLPEINQGPPPGRRRGDSFARPHQSTYTCPSGA